MNRISIIFGALVSAAAIAACGTASSHANRAAVSQVAARASRLTTPPATRVQVRDQFASGLPKTSTRSVPAPAMPGTAAGVAVASIPVVVELHDLAASISRQIKLPPGAIEGQASDLVGRFERLRRDVAAARSASRSSLVGAMASYAQISERLGAGKRQVVTTLSASLAAADRRWRDAVARVAGGSDARVSSMIPRLLPIGPAATAISQPGR